VSVDPVLAERSENQARAVSDREPGPGAHTYQIDRRIVPTAVVKGCVVDDDRRAGYRSGRPL